MLYNARAIISGSIKKAKYENEFKVLLYKSLILVEFELVISKFICLKIFIIRNITNPKFIIIEYEYFCFLYCSFMYNKHPQVTFDKYAISNI